MLDCFWSSSDSNLPEEKFWALMPPQWKKTALHRFAFLLHESNCFALILKLNLKSKGRLCQEEYRRQIISTRKAKKTTKQTKKSCNTWAHLPAYIYFMMEKCGVNESAYGTPILPGNSGIHLIFSIIWKGKRSVTGKPAELSRWEEEMFWQANQSWLNSQESRHQWCIEGYDAGLSL